MSKIFKCVIVDDEPPAIRLLEKYINQVTFLELIASTTKPLEALEILEKGHIDLVFLDIQMPNLTGIQLSKLINDSTKVIFTTAYPQFALVSYELNAVDYLLKPFEFERFYKAVSKLKTLEKPALSQSSTDDYLFIKTDGKNNYEKVYINEISYIEGLKNYVAVHLLDSQIITYNTLKHIEESLLKYNFIKIHKSYIVSVNHIEKTSSISVFINQNELPIGDTFRKAFFEKISQNKL